MAISKTQNERPAIGALIDSANALEEAVTGINDNISELHTFLDSLKIGATEEITVPASGSYSGSVSYSQPFAEADKSIVILGFVGNQLQDTLELTLIDSAYAGFSYSIGNTGAEAATATVGYLAVKVG